MTIRKRLDEYNDFLGVLPENVVPFRLPFPIEIEPLARAGVAFHWLKPRSKAPIAKNWSAAPRNTYRRLMDIHKSGNNVGIRLGKPSKIDDYYLHALDIDIRDNDCEREAIAWLNRHIPGWRKLPFVRSGSGGKSRHIYFLTDRPFSGRKLARSSESFRDDDGKKHWAWEIDLFGTGKQVAAPPSIHPVTGKAYTWGRALDLDDLDLGIGPILDSSLVESLSGLDRVADSEQAEPLDRTEDQIRATLTHLDLDEWCVDRDGWLRVGMALHHQFGGSKEGLKIWNEFSRQAEGKFDLHENRYQWRHFETKDSKSVTTFRSIEQAVRETETADLDIQDLGPLDKSAEAPAYVSKINKRHAFALVEGKAAVINEEQGGKITFSPVESFKQAMLNKTIAVEDKEIPIAPLWLKSKYRRQYLQGVVFEPNPAYRNDDAYNLWTGFAVKPDASGSCERFLWHARHVICAGNREHFDYLMGWLAHMVQRPWDKPGVAVILRGGKGTGKDVFGRYLSKLVGRHYINLSQQKHLLGNFNSHLQSTLLVHLEEAIWAGDKSADSALKSLITAPTLAVEPKGLPLYSVTSCHRLLMSSNEQWVVPATENERRYFVLDVSDRCQGDHGYFADLWQEMDQGGAEALLAHLQAYDLSSFNVRAVPNTAALADQKIAGLRGIEAWLLDILTTGDLPDADSPWKDGRTRVPKRDLYEAHADYVRGRRYDGNPLSNLTFGKHLSRLIPLSDVKMKGVAGQRINGYSLPALKECRDAFARHLGAANWRTLQGESGLSGFD